MIFIARLLCSLKIHNYRNFDQKELYFNPDVDLGGNVAVILLSRQCVECGFRKYTKERVFTAFQFSMLNDCEREKVIRKIFDGIDAYKLQTD